MIGSSINAEKPQPSKLHQLGTLLAVICGLILVRSAKFHLGNPFGFLATVYSYEILPQWGGVAVAAILPAVQLVLGLLLVLFPQPRKFCLKVAGTLFLGLAAVQIITLYRGLNISCGCFGPSVEENPIGAASIGLAIACCASAFTANWMINHEQTPPAEV